MDNLTEVAQEFARQHPLEFARFLEPADSQEALILLSEFSGAISGEVFSFLSPPVAALLIERMDARTAAKIFHHLEPSHGASLLRRCPPDRVEELLAGFPDSLSKMFRRLLAQPKGSAGALMDPTALSLPGDVAVKEAWKLFLQQPQHALYYLYVVDRSHRLVGVLNIKELALADKEARLETVMCTDVLSVPASTDPKSLAQHEGWLTLHALPVVDAEDKFLGVIRFETLRALETDRDRRVPRAGASEIGSALGEVYWLGLTGLVEGLASSVRATAGTREKK